jgi:DNA-binding XRE family transcriptional regulator
VNKVKEYRQLADISQEKLARYCDCTLRTIQNIENKDYSPSVYLAIKIKNALNALNVEDIFKLD